MRISDWSSDVCSSDLVAFLVAGDQQRDRPMRTPASQVLADGGDEGGNGALHVDGTAAVKRAVTDLAGEGVDAPGGGIADRHHVGMTGVAEVRSFIAEPGVEVVHPRTVVLGEGKAATGEGEAGQHRLQNIESART